MPEPVVSTSNAFLLGLVEGVTEYLPISSTGHLVIASDLLGLRSLNHLSASQVEAVQAFEVVIQGGAILAVVLLYRKYLFDAVLGAFGKSTVGRRLLINMTCATLPILAAGYLLKDVISQYLQFTGPVLLSLTAGGLAMLAFERSRQQRPFVGAAAGGLEDLTWKQSLVLGGLQCLALWPGTSRSMVTIICGMTVGLRRPAAAEFSFLIGLPALLAATIYKAAENGHALLLHVGPTALLIGMVTSTLFAALAMRWLISFLNRNGLSLFAWYRLALAAVLFLFVGL